MALSPTIPSLTPEQKVFWEKGFVENTQELLSFEPSALITFYELKYSRSILRFFSGVVEQKKDGKLTGLPFTKEIIYGGVPYYPIPCEDQGFEISSNNKFPRPRIKVSNIVNKFRKGNEGEAPEKYMVGERFMSTIMRSHNDLENARIKRFRVFLRFIDDENFGDAGNPFGDPNTFAVIEESNWVISQKINENKFYIEFELSSVFDVENVYSPARRMGSKYCSFIYRGEGCRYAGIPKTPKNNEKFTYIDPIDLQEKIITLKQRFPTEILEYDPTGIYNIGDSCFVSSPATYFDNSAGKDISFTIGEVNLSVIPVRTFYVCKRYNDGVDRKHPSSSPDYWIVDACDKTLEGCRRRFGDETVGLWDRKQLYYELPFGGFPGLDPLTYV